MFIDKNFYLSSSLFYGMGVYFFEKSLSFLSPVLCVVFKILKLPQNLSFKLGYFQKTKKNLQKMRKKYKNQR